MNFSKKLIPFLVVAVASPSAFAARDQDGMRYTSASEGFYGSIRVGFSSSAVLDETETEAALPGPAAGDLGSRLGVQGAIDLGNGLEGTYRFEWAAVGAGVRDLFVGLRSDKFGHFQFVQGADGVIYNNIVGAIDFGSGISYRGVGAEHGVTGVTYNSPDFSGFSIQAHAGMNNANTWDDITFTGVGRGAAELDITQTDTVDDRSRVYNVVVSPLIAQVDDAVTATRTETPLTAGLGNDATPSILETTLGGGFIDSFGVGARYSRGGLSIAAGFDSQTKGLTTYEGNISTAAGTANVFDDAGDSYSLELTNTSQNTFGGSISYGQDNWTVAGFFAQQDRVAGPLAEDAVVFQTNNVVFDGQKVAYTTWGIGANIAFNKVVLSGVFEAGTDKSVHEDNEASSWFSVDVAYLLGSKSKVYAAYASETKSVAGHEVDSASDGTYKSQSYGQYKVGLRMDF